MHSWIGVLVHSWSQEEPGGARRSQKEQGRAKMSPDALGGLADFDHFRSLDFRFWLFLLE